MRQDIGTVIKYYIDTFIKSHILKKINYLKANFLLKYIVDVVVEIKLYYLTESA